MDGATGGDLDGVRQSPQQALADLASSPGWFLAPGSDDCRLYWLGQLIGVTEGPANPVAQAFQATLLRAFQDLVARLAGDIEFPAQRGHTFAVFEPDHEAHTFIHNRTFPPWHVLHLGSRKPKGVTHVSGTFCYLCLGTVKFSVGCNDFALHQKVLERDKRPECIRGTARPYPG